MYNFVKFNLYEGTFWITLGVACLIINRLITPKYGKIAIVSSTILILFGISDYIEVKVVGFLYPMVWWLLAWKVLCIIGMIFIIGWYFKLRLKK